MKVLLVVWDCVKSVPLSELPLQTWRVLLAQSSQKSQEPRSLLWWESPSLIKHSQRYRLALCRLPATASREVLGRCVLQLCSCEYMFEGDAVFRVDVWEKTILAAASFLELSISFLPISRDSLAISYLVCLPVASFDAISNQKNSGIFFMLLTCFCLCPFLCISIPCSYLAVSFKKRYSSSNCFKGVITGNFWEPAIQFSGTLMWRIFQAFLPCMQCVKFSSDVFGHHIISLYLVGDNLSHSNGFVLAKLV